MSTDFKIDDNLNVSLVESATLRCYNACRTVQGSLTYEQSQGHSFASIFQSTLNLNRQYVFNQIRIFLLRLEPSLDIVDDAAQNLMDVYSVME